MMFAYYLRQTLPWVVMMPCKEQPESSHKFRAIEAIIETIRTSAKWYIFAFVIFDMGFNFVLYFWRFVKFFEALLHHFAIGLVSSGSIMVAK